MEMDVKLNFPLESIHLVSGTPASRRICSKPNQNSSRHRSSFKQQSRWRCMGDHLSVNISIRVGRQKQEDGPETNCVSECTSFHSIQAHNRHR